jgi:hypothetical protein
MVAASEIDPFQRVKKVPKLLFKSFKNFFECLCALLAQRMKVKAVTLFSRFGVKIGQCRTEP